MIEMLIQVPALTFPRCLVGRCFSVPSTCAPRIRFREASIGMIWNPFFWVLLWILLDKSGHSADNIFEPWSAGPWGRIWMNKYGFLMGPIHRRLAMNFSTEGSMDQPLMGGFS